jgi:hypothetical protein
MYERFLSSRFLSFLSTMLNRRSLFGLLDIDFHVEHDMAPCWSDMDPIPDFWFIDVTSSTIWIQRLLNHLRFPWTS